ncbi:MAG: hypothetical protein JST63_12405 [Bacteroidetes bacterium]|nr:hypothetical protein [Bacteroidota bacterium]
MQQHAIHTFHIPVMGLAFTIDSPVKVARYGISSVISIVEDKLIEMMRRHYYPWIGKEYQPIGTQDNDYRARRITDYLNLVNTIVQAQVEKLKNAAFEAGSEIVKYFEMLPEHSSLKQLYRQMIHAKNAPEKEKLEALLRTYIKPGGIDVNIMTKIDRNNFDGNGEVLTDGSDAVSALRGYAKSNLTNSSVIFSAGMNPRLYNYLGTCSEFDINEDGGFSKRIIVKVSDYRSALIQGKYLAKKGIWVSEFRIESGLNCGGHAFATDGFLLGPILEEFRIKKLELTDSLFEIYSAACLRIKNKIIIRPPQISVSVQGGIGTYEEDEMLRHYYGVDSTGWGTPFLLVPEATTVDENTLNLLCAAEEKDMALSRNSPLGVRFHYLNGTSSHAEKLSRIARGKPGSPCTEKHLVFNTEFTKEPICTASRKYQELKIAQLQSLDLPETTYKEQAEEVLDKECLCIGLSNSAAIQYNQSFVKKLNAVAICPGPNIVNFSKVVSLQSMTDHIYGRKNILTNSNRPNMFIAELKLYIKYFEEKLEEESKRKILEKNKKHNAGFFSNLLNGISYYRSLPISNLPAREIFVMGLDLALEEIQHLNDLYSLTGD